jgi:hypothetical protein
VPPVYFRGLLSTETLPQSNTWETDSMLQRRYTTKLSRDPACSQPAGWQSPAVRRGLAYGW